MEFVLEERMKSELNKEAFLIDVMNKYGDDVLRLIYSYVKQQDVAEDLAQDVFLKVFQKIEQYEHRSSFKTWLFRIAINSSKDYIKSWHVRHVEANDYINAASDEHSETPEDRVLVKSDEEELVNYILSLPLKYREVIYLFYYEECSTQMISQLLKVNENTVKTRLFQARKKLKLKMRK
ncbi:sigma-70 family RNA polymerase sigma factor [Halalkalibacter urbisdiaboli]|uniref:sigma-70 family RNA polymerase sigma factor n=1 Tax=Halalkalibacter urbisdiaboli TaxID=1960589 RepID=UPI000B432EB0|nr:sigma-70 family RNA polymerase sigma factor [Halalkalibacter urbisdiaboli]